MTDADPPTLHAALLRAFLTATLPGEPYRRLAEDPEAAADVAARVAARFVTEAMESAAAELFIPAARAAAAEIVEVRLDKLEAKARHGCSQLLRARAASLRTAAEGHLLTGEAKRADAEMAEARTYGDAADLIDPPGAAVPVVETEQQP